MEVEFAYETAIEDVSYEDALLYCMFLEHDGKRGWRLPTFKEVEDHLAVGFIGRTHWMWCSETKPSSKPYSFTLGWKGNIQYVDGSYDYDYDSPTSKLAAIPCRTITSHKEQHEAS